MIHYRFHYKWSERLRLVKNDGDSLCELLPYVERFNCNSTSAISQIHRSMLITTFSNLYVIDLHTVFLLVRPQLL